MPHAVTLDRRDTSFTNSFLEEYYFSDKLDSFKSYSSIADIEKAISNKANFSNDKRTVLVKVLKDQYAEFDLSQDSNVSVAQNIASLRNENTFTVTTGQQIHIGLGPLYVLYKAFDAIAIAQELREKYKGQNFVPVFWMATEDHDLEEIAQVSVFGKTLEWETDQKGAVGRMKPEGVSDLFQNILDDFNFGDAEILFLNRCKEIYTDSTNLSVAFRRLLHSYLGHTGLIILDADSAELKKSFKPVFRDEISHANYQALEGCATDLESAGHARQLNIRENNLFTLTNGDRLKVDSAVVTDIDSYVNDNYADLSPNAALRPLYQEWVLPNIVYVGGGAEVKYWSQLKGLFDNYQLPMPYLHLRSSKVILPEKIHKNYGDIGVVQLFGSADQLRAVYAKELAEEQAYLSDLYTKTVGSLSDYNASVELAFKGFSLSAKADKIRPKLQELEELVSEQIKKKSEQNPELNKVLKIQAKYFCEDRVQERTEHLLAYPELLAWPVSNIQLYFGLKKNLKAEVVFI
jgi:bacillithiol biosynthesis cysteine-adding enzyme BshC